MTKFSKRCADLQSVFFVVLTPKKVDKRSTAELGHGVKMLLLIAALVICATEVENDHCQARVLVAGSKCRLGPGCGGVE